MMREPIRKLSAAWLLEHMHAPSSPQAMLAAVAECYGLSEDETKALDAIEFQGMLAAVMAQSGLMEDASEGKPDPRDGA